MKLFICAVALMLAGCTSVEQVIENKEVYCSGIYKGTRAVGRTLLSATTGVVLPDVCDTIDTIVAKDATE